MTSNIPMFSLKTKSLKWKGNEKQVLLIVLACIFIYFWGVLGVAATIIAYILLSLFPRKGGKHPAN